MMDIDVLHSLLLILMAVLATLLTRFLPFLVFGKRELPKWLKYLGDILPAAIMGTLVIYCFKNTDFRSFSGCLPQLIAGGVTAGLHIWRKNTLLSIAAGTVVYMILIRVMV